MFSRQTWFRSGSRDHAKDRESRKLERVKRRGCSSIIRFETKPITPLSFLKDHFLDAIGACNTILKRSSSSGFYMHASDNIPIIKYLSAFE